MSPSSRSHQPEQLTAGQVAKARAWLQKHWTTPDCPFHGKTQWRIGNVLAQTVSYVEADVFIGGATYPLLVVICVQCGHTVFLNAITTGIIGPDTPDDDKVAPGGSS